MAVVGGGAAGMRAAAAAAELGARVRLFEKNTVLGKKLRITGKGRCNVTNDCPPDEFMAGIPANSRFLWSALPVFAKDTINRERLEFRRNRAREKGFPVSTAPQTYRRAIRDCRRTGVEIVREKVIR